MKKRQPKYRNQKLVVDGEKFDSIREYNRWCQLQLLERCHEISVLRRQIPFDIIINGMKVCRYIADHVYYENGTRIVEDVKGVKTRIYSLKKKLMKAVLGIEIREV